MKPDWFSRLLLVVILLLVAYLALRPQAGRYRFDDSPYVFDTATGTIRMLSADEKVKEHWRKLDAEEKAKEAAEKQERSARMERDCPPLLSSQRKPSNNVVDEAFHRREVQGCKEWLASR